jgi:hypothetical protein
LDRANGALDDLIRRLEGDETLLDPENLRRRSEALDLLDMYWPGVPLVEATPGRNAALLRAKLEAADSQLFSNIRQEICHGRGAKTLLPWSRYALSTSREAADGFGYDFLDELVAGIFQIVEPEEGDIQRRPETVFYQPTPARHIFRMIGPARITADDVLVDLGSGLGHVVLLTAVCTSARALGVELEGSYVECARRCAQQLNIERATFLHQDARLVDLSMGTVFYLHTPFSGSILETVLGRLRDEAATRPIRVCAFGPCTERVGQQPWLQADGELRPDRVAAFRSQS